MPRKLKNFRMENETILLLDALVAAYQRKYNRRAAETLPIHKKITETDVIISLIHEKAAQEKINTIKSFS